jgi:glucokinase
VPVRELLEEAFACPATVLNDVDAGTFGEYRFGAGQQAASVLGVFPGTGLGGGFVFRDQILHGSRFSCMELGDIRMGGASLLQSNDEWPTLEDLTSRLAITSAIAVEAYRGKAPSLEGLPISKIKSKAIAKSIEAGEEAVEAILDQSISILGKGLAGVVSLLGPEVIVLGGGLVERFPQRYEAGLEQQLAQLVTSELVQGLTIRKAVLGDDAGAMGAAAYTEVEKPAKGDRI